MRHCAHCGCHAVAAVDVAGVGYCREHVDGARRAQIDRIKNAGRRRPSTRQVPPDPRVKENDQ